MKIRINLFILLFLVAFYFTKQIEIYLVLMAFVLLHEMGHMIVGLWFRFKIQYIEIMPFGFSIRFQEQNNSKEGMIEKNFQKAVVALAGPMVNIICAIILIQQNIEQVQWIYANLWIAIFNLLPIYPLDGGRILEAVLDMKFNYRRKKDFLEKITIVMIVILTGIGSVLVFYYENILIFLGVFYLWFMLLQQKNNFIKQWY